MIQIILRSQLKTSKLVKPENTRLILINDLKSPVYDTTNIYGVEIDEVHSLFDYIENNKENLIKGFLSNIDSFYQEFRQTITSTKFRNNILLYNFSSKRTDLYRSFEKYSLLELSNDIKNTFPTQNVNININYELPLHLFSVTKKFKLIIHAFIFFCKVIFLWLMLNLNKKSNVQSIDNNDVLFYTQLPRQKGKELGNINYGKVFNHLSIDMKCIYVLSLLTDGIHDGPSFSELYKRTKNTSAKLDNTWILERVINLKMLLRIMNLFIHYIYVVISIRTLNSKYLTEENRYIFHDELLPTIRRMFNYSYVLELSLNLSQIIKSKTFIYYLFEHNYGKLLSFYLHDFNLTMGCQHGTISHMRLGQYFTKEELRITQYPEYIITEGFNHEKSLKWIYPNLNIEVLGAPRVEHLHQIKEQPTTNLTNLKPSVLVPLSLHGNLDILNYVVTVLKSDLDVNFYIKTHPAAGKRQKDEVENYLEQSQINSDHTGYSIHECNVYDFIGKVNYIMFTDSSVGIEFAEIGIIPICIEPNSSMNLSPLIDIGLFNPEASLKNFFVSDPSQLLNILSIQNKYVNNLIPNNFYFAYLGNSSEIWSDFIRAKSYTITPEL